MTKRKLYILTIALSFAGYAWTGWNIREGFNDSSATVCLFKTVTHLPCPSCGTTRAMVMLAEGNFRQSLMYNPFGAMLAIALIVFPLWIFTDGLRRKDSFFRWYTSTEHWITEKNWIAVPATAVLVLNWVWNITKGL